MANQYLIYGRNSCPFCCMACDFLSAANQTYIFLDHEEDREFLEEAKTFYSFQTVPIILENDMETGRIKKIGGYTDMLEYFK